MIVYFTDRNLNVLGSASTALPSGLRIYEDTTTEDIESGVTTFAFRVACNNEPLLKLEPILKEGNYIIKGNGSAFNEEENIYNSLFEIVESEYNSAENSIYIYAEDAGLELLNKVAPAAKLEKKTLLQMLEYFIPEDWNINLIGTPTGTKTYEWEGENTLTERILSIAAVFNCEVFYSFNIDAFRITGKNINVLPHRGTPSAVPQLRLGREISNIIKKTSKANLATAYEVKGSDSVNLKNYTYSYTDEKGDTYTVDKTTGQMRNITQMAHWASALDSDGLIIKQFEFDTKDKAKLAGEARAALQVASYPEVNYEVEFVSIPEDVKIGDRVNIIDSENELFLDARILVLETSVSAKSITATLGDYLIKDSGITEQIAALAAGVKGKDGTNGITITITSSGGNTFHNTAIETTLTATVFSGNLTITNQDELIAAFGDTAVIKWFRDETQLGTGFTYSVSSSNSSENIKVVLEYD